MIPGQPSELSSFALLQSWVRKRSAVERCELCSAELGPEHAHLIEPAGHRLLCACEACALLFSGQQSAHYRRVLRRIQYLPNLELTDLQWEELRLPINLAFFFYSSHAGRVVAMYPSPAGAIESLLTLEVWRILERQNPILRDLEPDVEAILVNRVGSARDYYRVAIDECYKLVGLIRTHWRGLSGGAEVWHETERFFGNLQRMSGTD